MKDIVGKEGNLLFPTYTWDFCNSGFFDYRKTPCKTGVLSITALHRKDFIRTKHPIYSFAVWGKDADLLYHMENKSSFGKDSPFSYLHKVGAKNLIIDVSYQHSFTFGHYVEENTPGVAYRYNKEFTAQYIDIDGESEISTYSMFVRDLEKNVFNDSEPMDEIFVRERAVKKYDINGVKYKVLDLAKAYELTEKDILYNKSRRLCTYIGQNE